MKSAAIAPAWTKRHEPQGQMPTPAGGSLGVESQASLTPSARTRLRRPRGPPSVQRWTPLAVVF
jgi:hypothetical protein